MDTLKYFHNVFFVTSADNGHEKLMLEYVEDWSKIYYLAFR